MSNTKIVQDLVAAFNRDDLEAAYALMCDDIVYHNIPMPPVQGLAAVRQFFAEAAAMTDNNWQILHIAENGAVVMTERVDNMRLGGTPISIPVMGIFELSDGRIRAWRDYFDLAMFQRQLASDEPRRIDPADRERRGFALHGRLESRRALVTGAADGIGAAIAQLFAQEGARVLAVDIDGEKLAKAHAGHDDVVCETQDVAAPDAADRLIARAEQVLGGLDILVNNAGISQVAPLASTSDELWSRTMTINIDAVFRLCRAAIPMLERSSHARIVNIGSIMSSYGGAGLGAYSASKHAIAGLTKTLATELGALGVTANYIEPGAIVTGITRDLLPVNAAFEEFWRRKAALGRWGEPIDVARAALFLASDDSRFVSGIGLRVDGGAMQSP